VDQGLKRYEMEAGWINHPHGYHMQERPEGEYVLYADHVASTEAMRKALEAAWHALKSYEYGNASPDLAKAAALVVGAVLAARAAEQGTEEKDADI